MRVRRADEHEGRGPAIRKAREAGLEQARLLGFQRRYQQTAVPFDWRYTRADLDRLLRRLDTRARRATAA